MRYIGLGWEEAYHPWSYKGRAFTADELFEHLINFVIPLADSNQPPLDPPVKLPKVGDQVNFGTKSAAQKRLDDLQATKKEELRKSIKDRVKELEEEGEMDAIEYMQQKVWPIERILQTRFRIQICWKYYDEDDSYHRDVEVVYWNCSIDCA
jgi:hypothetical protein